MYSKIVLYLHWELQCRLLHYVALMQLGQAIGLGRLMIDQNNSGPVDSQSVKPCSIMIPIRNKNAEKFQLINQDLGFFYLKVLSQYN